MLKQNFTAHFVTDEGIATLFEYLKKYRNKLADEGGEFYISRIEIYNDNTNCEATVTVDKYLGASK
jgi:hypothetical protein